jgi:phosphoribosylanthranilate isomerase
MTTGQKDLLHAAGIIDAAEAQLLIDCGFDCLGFPLVLDHHAEDLTATEAAAIVGALSGQARFFLITYLSRAADIAALCSELGVKMVQLHGDIALDQLEELRTGRANLRIIKSLIVRGDDFEGLAQQVIRFAPLVDAFITDTFDSATGASGATGKTHDWEISRKLVALSSKPVILAGGLNPDNVGEAIAQVRPAGVDVHSGIEGPDGRKSRQAATRFVAVARDAFTRLV